MSHRITMVDCAKNGSICTVSASGISTMSDSLIAFQPAIEEPSNMTPSANMSSSTSMTSIVTCCSLPFGSVKRRSTNFTSLSLICFMMSLAVVMSFLPCVMTFRGDVNLKSESSDGVHPRFAGTDANDLLDIGDEDLAVADAAGLRRLADGFDGAFDGVVAQHHFDLHLGQEV